MADRGGFATRCITVGQAFDPQTGAVIPPIYQTSTFVQKSPGVLTAGYEYARVSNPTRSMLGKLVASLEDGNYGFVFPSGMSAEDTVLRAILRPGDHAVVGRDVYGGTFRILDRVFRDWGCGLSVVDESDLDEVARAIVPETRVVWVETPSNPVLRIFDLAAIVDMAHSANALVVADNTFASPVLQKPLNFGVDVVTHSATKYLAGHSDVLIGMAVVRDEELAQKIGDLQVFTGPTASPMDCFLTVRGIKTLPIRVRQHCQNAQSLAEHLVLDSRIEQVYYPGLPDHPGHELAAKQMSGLFGGIVSVRVKGGPKAAQSLARNTTLFNLAESVGGVESLVCYPCEMTHLAVKGTDMAVCESLVRFSVGIEDLSDQIADIDQALGCFRG